MISIMMVQDSLITECVQKLADHFTLNIATRFLRPYLAGILAESELARRIADLTEHPESFSSQGIHVDELYQQILAMARFVYLVRIEVLPNIRNMASSGPMDANKVYRDMAMNNFGANMKVLSDYVNELFVKTVEYDKIHSGRHPTVYRSMVGLEEIGRYLVDK